MTHAAFRVVKTLFFHLNANTLLFKKYLFSRTDEECASIKKNKTGKKPFVLKLIEMFPLREGESLLYFIDVLL